MLRLVGFAFRGRRGASCIGGCRNSGRGRVESEGGVDLCAGWPDVLARNIVRRIDLFQPFLRLLLQARVVGEPVRVP